MSDGRSERTRLGLLGVHMDPLMVACRGSANPLILSWVITTQSPTPISSPIRPDEVLDQAHIILLTATPCAA